MAQTNADQTEFWNSAPGQNWVRYQADLDAISQAAGDLLLEACQPREGEAVLDVGCGAGASTLALARAVAPTGRVHGVDISSPLLERASVRRDELGIENVTFELADAQDHAFAESAFDLVASRFGLMFFADPVTAFRNIRSSLRSGGRIAFVAWAGPEENPWFAWPHRIATARLGTVPPTPPDAPGPMAFQDLERVKAILSDAGFSGCEGRGVAVDLHHPGGLEAVLKLVTVVGPAARVVREKGGTDEDRTAIAEEVAARFEQFRSSDGIRIPARVNLFTATAP
ncbi:class I SAM-dependent methyltransferase [Paracoccus sp. MC1854]|uniref:class I SAM-dependent methyltransferase n=1 Tax=Paracoccus sp. MC1854 TaxID=2760306 RepID=UPI00160399F7|nr:class I SAM-dependent methyltransferase [Paracoccus sp. MC1854]MBB1493196.1 class I SAM-dependent methyltransferase [Paracoccus sp. MC1854]